MRGSDQFVLLGRPRPRDANVFLVKAASGAASGVAPFPARSRIMELEISLLLRARIRRPPTSTSSRSWGKKKNLYAAKKTTGKAFPQAGISQQRQRLPLIGPDEASGAQAISLLRRGTLHPYATVRGFFSPGETSVVSGPTKQVAADEGVRKSYPFPRETETLSIFSFIFPRETKTPS